MKKARAVYNDPFSIEEIKPGPSSSELLVPSYKLRRFSYKGKRYYYNVDANGSFSEPAISSTSVCKFMASDPGLDKWKAEKGYAKAMAIFNETAFVGIFKHMLYQMHLQGLMVHGLQYSMYQEDVEQLFIEFAKLENRPRHLVEDKLEEVCKALYSFEAFCKDHKVKPLLIEHSLIDEDEGIACTVDLYCELTVREKGDWGQVYKSGPRKGEVKLTYEDVQKRVLIDFKNKNFYKSHELQLFLNARIFKNNFPEQPIDMLWNYAPADFDAGAANPKLYNVKDQTNSRQRHNVDSYISIAKVETGDIWNRPWKTEISGLFFKTPKPEGEELGATVLTLYEKCQELEKEREDAELPTRGWNPDHAQALMDSFYSPQILEDNE